MFGGTRHGLPALLALWLCGALATGARADCNPNQSYGDVVVGTTESSSGLGPPFFFRASSAALTIHLILTGPDASAFVPSPNPNGMVLQPFQEFDFQILFTPQHLGLNTVNLTWDSSEGVLASGSLCGNGVGQCPGPVVRGASANPNVLLTQDHSMVPVTVNYTVTDRCDPQPVCSLSVSSNDSVNGTGVGDTGPEWQVVDAHHVLLRAEQAGTGRVYTITITCHDSGGLTSSATVTISVTPPIPFVVLQPRQANPQVDSILVDHGPVGQRAIIHGSGFADVQGSSFATVGGHQVPVLAWSAQAIDVLIDPSAYRQSALPLGASYPVQVVTPDAGKKSNTVPFLLTSGQTPGP
jgi:hypothetical protein